METRDYSLRGDPEQMLRALRGGLPFGASLAGDSSHGIISVVFSGRVVEYWRNGSALRVTVYKGAAGKSEAEVWQIIEGGLSGHVG